MAQVGRISGPLLTSNLERQGIDLTFRNTLDTDPLLFLDVNNNRIGINYNGTPITDFYIPNIFKTDNLIATNSAQISNFTLSAESLSVPSGDIILNAGNSIVMTGFGTDDITSQNNYIKIHTLNTNLNLDPAGTGTIEVFSNMSVDGNIHATGNIRADENLTLGNEPTDEILINARINVDLIPQTTDTYDLGSSLNRFDEFHSLLLNGQNVTIASLAVDTLNNLGAATGNIFYVAENGSDDNRGDHPQGPFKTIKRALDAADGSSGGPVTIHIFAGDYEEENLPLVVPSNVTISGEDMRNTVVKPSIADFNFLNQIDNPNIYGTTTNDNFGQSLATNGTITVVSAYFEDTASASNTGSVYVIENATGNILQTINSPVSTTGTQFGQSVAINSTYICVGAPGATISGNIFAGQIFLYDIATYTLQLTINDPNAYSTTLFDEFGRSVAINDNYILAGAIGEKSSAGDTGSGVGYLIDISTGLVVHTFDNPNPYGTPSGDQVGRDVAINSTHSFISTSNEDDTTGINVGRVYMFDNSTGLLTRTFESPGSTAGTSFGTKINVYGSKLIVGAPTYREGGLASSGRAYIYDINSGNLLFNLANPNNYGTVFGDQFGVSVALTNNKAIIGANAEDTASDNEAGVVYVFSLISGELIQTIANPTTGTLSDDLFGSAISVSNNYLIVGALQAEDSGSSSGKAFIFQAESTISDIFLVTGETTIQNITVKDFYYDSVTDTGYAFRFAPNATITSRSPYIQNVTVITQGTTTSASDPRGFASGDAGKGALVDGADVLSSSQEASMLFHSVTFITPGVDAITMTNGVRVEWLNSFTYFANRGIYAVNGVTGHLSSDGSTVKYGAELRSIGSANVYGNYGIVGDGNDVLIYAINHNLAYIGTGKYADNDQSRTIQTNEVVKTNSAQVYYQTQDHRGDFRIGDNFYIDLDTGITSLNLTAAEFNSLNSLIIDDGTGVTEIVPSRIDVGDFRLSGNTVQTLSQTFTLDSHSTNNKIVFLANTNLTDSLTLTGDILIEGDFTYVGEQLDNTLTLGASIASDLGPGADGQYDLGSFTERWKTLYVSGTDISDIRFQDNFITTTISNADLEFRANSIGEVYIPDNTFEVENNLTINGTTNISQITISGDLTGSGSINSKNLTISDSLTTETINANSQTMFEDIYIDDNFITTSNSNSNLELRASGSGQVVFENLDINLNLNITNNLYVNENFFTNVYADLQTNGISIFQNVVETINSNSNLELRSFSGKKVRAEDVFFDQTTISTTSSNIILQSDLVDMSTANEYLLLPKGTNLQRDSNQGSIRYNTNTSLFEGYTTAYTAFNGIYSQNRFTNAIAHPTNNTLQFTVGSLVATFDNQKLTANGLEVENIQINNNTVYSAVSNSDLELIANGGGNIFFEDFEIQNNKLIQINTNTNTELSSTGLGYYAFGGTQGLVIPVGGTGDRPAGVVGQLRYNTDTSELEAYSGSEWKLAAGFFETVVEADAQDFNFENSLIFG